MRRVQIDVRGVTIIIRYPTGLYEDAGQLPKDEQDPKSVTYVISNDEPVRADFLVLQLPFSEEVRSRPPLAFDDSQRRLAMGELVYSLVSASRSEPGSNRRLFDVGEILDFETETEELPGQSVVPTTFDIQHNTNVLDLNDAGLSDVEIADLNIKFADKKKELEGEIAALQIQIGDTRTSITENQKQINENNKIINAVKLVSTSNDPLLVKLLNRSTELDAARTAFLNNLEVLNTQVAAAYDSLLQISTLVK